MEMKVALDPENRFLSSWNSENDPCSNTFEGIGCYEHGNVVNISLQGKGLSGRIPPAVSGLKFLSGLYLHYNSLSGEIPREISNLTELSDLYLNNNNLSGSIPPEIGDMANLQALKKLNGGFQYGNNSDLCGIAFPPLRACTAMDKLIPNKPEPFGPGTTPKDLPESTNFRVHCDQTNCSNPSKTPRVAISVGVIAITVALTVTGLLIFSWYRRRKQKIGSAFETSDSRLSTNQPKEVYRKMEEVGFKK